MEIVEIILALVNEFKDRPMFWLVVSPFILLIGLWLWNQVKKQAVEAGIPALSQRTALYAQARLWPHSKKWFTSPMPVPSPHSDRPHILWRVFLFTFGLLAFSSLPLAFIAVAQSRPPLTAKEQLIIIIIVIIMVWIVIGIPFSGLALLVNKARNKRISKAVEQMCGNVQRTDGTQVTLLEFFQESADDFLMGFDPRIANLEDTPEALAMLEKLLLVKPDKRPSKGQLAKRYYLTVTGATLRYRLKNESGRDGG